MLLNCCTQYASKFGKLSSGHRTGKGQFSFQSQRRAMPKNVQTIIQLHSFHMLARWCSKSFNLGFNGSWTKNFQMYSSVQFSRSIVSDSVTPWIAALQASLSITNFRSPPKPMSIESVMPSNHLILCCPLSSRLQSFTASGSFPKESVLCIRWPRYWSFS